MTKNANSKKARRGLAALNAVLLVAGVAGAYQLGVANKRPPSFSQGGEFASTDDLIRAGRDGRPFPYGDVTSLPLTTTTSAVTRATGALSPAQTTTPTTAAVLGARIEAPASGIAARGVYRFNVRGSEGASGFGSRDFPSTMTLAVHANEGKANERVFDLRFSDDHEEREIVRYGDDGLSFVYEAGSITFGPGTQTSEGTYKPPMVQVPYPLALGRTATGSSATSSRTERWTTKVVGRETIDVLGQARETWVVEIQRNTPPGATEEVDRYRKYWFDPALGIWVKWTERFTAARNGVVKFGYKASYTATLTAFSPA